MDLNRLFDALSKMTPDKLLFFNEVFTALLYEKILKDGDDAIDIGANHGRHTYNMLPFLGQRGRCFAFEPNPLLSQKLIDNVAQRFKNNLNVFQMACGEINEKLMLHIPENLDGWASLLDKRDCLELKDKKFTNILVSVINLDSFLYHKLEKLTFVKIDTEGFEFKVLKGMTRIISYFRPVIIFESPTEEIIAFFNKNFYQVCNFFGQPFDFNNIILPNALALPYGALSIFPWIDLSDIGNAFLRYERFKK